MKSRAEKLARVNWNRRDLIEITCLDQSFEKKSSLRRGNDTYSIHGLIGRRIFCKAAGRLAQRTQVRRAHRVGHLGGERRADVSRCADRALVEIQTRGTGHARSVSAQSEIGMGVVCLAA